MTCAMVLYFERPFEEVDDALGLSRAAEIRMVSTNPKDDIYILVSRGFEHVTPEAISRMAEMKYKIVDASGALAAVKARYAYANNPAIWRNVTFHEMCFLRWLVLEEYFGGASVLAMDSDIVWRVDPAQLFEEFQSGGNAFCYTSCCLAFIKDQSLYETYRSGLERMSTEPGFGSDFHKNHSANWSGGLYHDQALMQYLQKRGEIVSDPNNMLHRGVSDEYFVFANPLGITPGPGEPPLTFEQTPTGETIGGKKVPFWHMQTRFSRYLWTARFAPVFLSRPDIRIPYQPVLGDDPNLSVLLLDSLHQYIKGGKIGLHSSVFQPFKAMTSRNAIYDEFFNQSLATEIFTDAKWWKQGVWAH